MKIPASIRALYDSQLPRNRRLRDTVDKVLKNKIEERWHYESRVKEPESYALKLESGRFSYPAGLEDFFACTIVVNDRAAIARAETLVGTITEPQERRPHSDQKTNKFADSFPFDDLRLYVKWKDDASLPSSGLAGMLFEIQIKTYLQHAWSIATHDLVYKTDTISWPKERIAYQVKAMLEHAELSIQEADKLAESAGLPQEHDRSKTLVDVVGVLKGQWGKDELPRDLLRLARNVSALMRETGISLERLDAILKTEATAGKGPTLKNLSPFQAIVQFVVNQDADKLGQALSKRSKFKLLTVPELEIPGPLVAQLKNIVQLPAAAASDAGAP